VLATGSRVYCDEKSRVELDAYWYYVRKHLFQESLFKTLVHTVKGNTAHLRVD
jgi:hypothetical protein